MQGAGLALEKVKALEMDSGTLPSCPAPSHPGPALHLTGQVTEAGGG